MKLIISMILAALVSSAALANANLTADAESIFREYQVAKLEIPQVSVAALAEEYDRKIVPGTLTLSSSKKKQLLSANEFTLVNNPMVKKLAALLTENAGTEIEKVISIHNFVLWRITHAALFVDPAKTNESMASPKGRLNECLNKHYSRKRDKYFDLEECGLSAQAETEALIQQVLYTGLHNCAGYAYMFQSLARAAGIPTMIAREPQTSWTFGHYWNQVFIKGQWLVVDATFDDAYDRGTYDANSTMKLDFTYFLVTPKEAARLDGKYHAKFVLEI